MLSRLSKSVAVAALAIGFASPGFAATDIGGVTASNPLMEGSAGTAGKRALIIGSRVIENEQIETSPDGSGQLLFLDQTTLTIAPASSVVLDTYVYDPARTTGQIGMSLTRGALRFIGGRITKLRDAVIGTPAATIGIRGGAAYLDVASDGTTTIIHIAGERTRVANEQGQVSLIRPSTKAIIRPGEAPRIVGFVSPAEIDRRYGAFEGGGGGLRTNLDPLLAGRLTERAVQPYGSDDLGAEGSAVVATNGGTFEDDSLPEREREGIGLTVSPNGESAMSEPEPPTNPPVVTPPVTPPSEPVLEGVFGVTAIASPSRFTGIEGTAIDDTEAQNVILGPGQLIELTEVRTPNRIGIAANGDRYVIPVSDTGSLLNYTDGVFPDGTLAGSSEVDPLTGFVTSSFVTDGGRSGMAFFGTGTPGQLGEPVDLDAIELRGYSVDAFTGDTFDSTFTDPLTANLTLIEQQGEGFRDEGNPLGFAKASHVVLRFENATATGNTSGQSSFLSVGTGRISDSSRGAPLPDLGIYGSVQRAGSATPTTFEGGGTVIESGDGSTVFGPDGEHIIFGNGSRFAFADATDDDGVPITDEDIEPTPIAYDAFEGMAPAANGFLGRGDLATRTSVDATDRLTLGVAYADAVRDDGFTLQNDDTAFTGGYAAGIGISNRDGVNGDPYILRSNGSDGAQFSFDASQNEVNAVLSMLQGPRTATASSTPPGNGPSGADIGTVTYGFGSASTRSALISDRNFALRNRTTQDIGFIPGDTNIDGSTGRETAGVQQAFRGALISNDAAGDAANTIYGDTVADDDHQYLRWGWWSGEFRFSDEDTSDFAGRRERTHLGTWIAGNRLDQSIVMARQGAANFDGHAIVSIVDANGQSVNGGSFDLSYDFDEGFGEARFRGLAGYDFDIGVSTTGSLTDRSAPHYTGRETDLAGATGMPNIDVGVTGSFFGDRAADSVRATAGHIDIQSTDGTSLIGSGTFGGDIIDPNT